MGSLLLSRLLQLDELDQNAAVNKAGQVVGAFTPVADQVSTDSLAPYRFVRARWVYGGARVVSYCLTEV